MNDQQAIVIQPNNIYDYFQVMNMLGVRKNTLSKLIKQNELRYKRVGRQYLFLGEFILEFMKK